ncbi:hypothetical protein ASF16_02065 [Acidovorax sp. Leaf78]|nr:hypothetical protein ASF16_02065 [Acidovorax sp. Leaf78]
MGQGGWVASRAMHALWALCVDARAGSTILRRQSGDEEADALGATQQQGLTQQFTFTKLCAFGA